MVTIAFEILACSHNVFLLRSTFLLLMKNPSVYPEKVEQSNDCQRQDSVAFAKDSQSDHSLYLKPGTVGHLELTSQPLSGLGLEEQGCCAAQGGAKTNMGTKSNT